MDVSVSVVIPTLNAGREFCWLLRKLQAQQGPQRLEIVVVDSGSQDETLRLAHAAGCTVIEISPDEFSHSYARNRGADMATGDYLLFMVQDAYPIGDRWILGMLQFLFDHSKENIAAVSCSEYSRSDSDVMYDSIIYNHYRFLGCLREDRIGEYHGNDHTLLRSYGQLSDVTCLISRELFQRYRYRGDYAEDLDLGIRLIKDSYRVAMLASVKTIHSHNRPAYYYLKRSFVDTIYLVELFDDYVYPQVESVTGLMAGIVSTAAHLTRWISGDGIDNSAHQTGCTLGEWMKQWRGRFEELDLDAPVLLDDDRLNDFIERQARSFLGAGKKMDSAARRTTRMFVDSFLARIEHLENFVSSVYPPLDALHTSAIRNAVCKSLASTMGSLLGFAYMDLSRGNGAESDMAAEIKNELQVGI